MIWQLVHATAWWLVVVFTISAVIRMMFRAVPSGWPTWLVKVNEFGNHLWNELKYAYLVSEIVGPFLHAAAYGERTTWLDFLLAGVGGAYWFWVRRYFDDDDRWKKRKAKLTEKIARVGSRLVVVPEAQ